MGHRPDTVNAQGQVLTDEMKDQLGGGNNPANLFKDNQGLPDPSGPSRASEIFRNWLFGPQVKPIDPTEAIARSVGLKGQYQAQAQGSGMMGLFGLTPLDLGPMQKGVPYSVPPIPTLRPR